MALVGVGGLAALAYTLGLGIYVVASTAPDVASQPETPEEADLVIARLGLEQEYPFEHRFVETPHGRMHYVEAGEGDPILCLHGNPTWSFLYRNFLKGLSGSHRVIAPDLIGFGLSEKMSRPEDYSAAGHVEDISALVEALDLENLTLVLQDWGGPIGLGMAVNDPDRIRALVVMNTIGFVPDDPDVTPLPLLALRAPIIGEQLVQGLGLFSRLVVPVSIERDERKPPLVRRAYNEVQGSWNDRAGTRAFPDLPPRDPDDPVMQMLEREDRFLRQFRGPVLIAWGMRDPIFGPDLLDEWQRRFPQAAVLELPGASHFPQEDAYEEVVPWIRALLRSDLRDSDAGDTGEGALAVHELGVDES